MAPGARQRYRIDEVIGSGGFGIVYRAEVLSTDGASALPFSRTIALKMVSPEHAARPEHIARLCDEAVLLGRLRHRAIVTVHGLAEIEGQKAIEMEYLPGVGLDVLSRAIGPLPLSETLQMMEEIAAGLHALHTAIGPDGAPLAAVHRDITPKNLRLTPQGEVKILDFGSARFTAQGRQLHTGSLLIGTRGYIAPERLDGECDASSDIYALALTLLALLTAHPPEQTTTDPERHATRIDASCARMADAGAPASVCALMRAALSWEPSGRPSAIEFARQCRSAWTSLPDRPLRDWADLVVSGCAETQSGTPTIPQSALVGRVVTKEPAANVPVVQDPEEASAQIEAKRRPVQSAVSQNAAPHSVPQPQPAQPQSVSPAAVQGPPPDVRPERRRSSKLRWFVLLSLGIGLGLLASAAAALSAAAGGTAVFGALVVAALSESDGLCISTVRATRQELSQQGIEGFRTLAPIFEREMRDCREGRIGFFGAALTMGTVRNLSRDSIIDDNDIIEITEMLEAMESDP